MEEIAGERQLTLLTSDVSITAEPFFLANGFTLIQKQNLERQGITLINYRMSKLLNSAA